MAEDRYDVHSEILNMLLRKVAEDKYPSATMMDMIEQLISPEDRPKYAAVLMEKVQADKYPSIPMMQRLLNLG